MSTQKALYVPSKQAPLKLGDAPIYTPGPKEVLVKVISSALNTVDWKIHTYGLFVEHFPAILGSDIAGVVEKVGAEVTTFEKGDRVLFQGWFSDNKYAGFQQYAIIDAELAAKIPDNISFDQAASIPVALIAVVIPHFNHNPAARTANLNAPWEEGGQTKYAGKPAFIVGGASSVGQNAIQVAKYSGYSPIITTASPHNAGFLKSLGASAVLDRTLSASALLAAVRELAGGQPVEYVFDAISAPDTQALAYDALAPGGTLFIVLDEAIPAEKKQQEAGVKERKRVVHGFGSVHVPENRGSGLGSLWVEVLPGGLAGIPDGLKRLKQDMVSGKKLIARPQETA